GGRGARCQTRGAFEAKPQGRLAGDGREHERAASARVRPDQTKGPAAQAQGVNAWVDAARCLRPFSARVRRTSSTVSTGTGARSVLTPGRPASARRSTSLSLSVGASLLT